MSDAPTEKICSGCKTLLPLGQFAPERRGLYGRKSRCRLCASTATAKWTAQNRDRANASKLKWYYDNREKEAARVARARAANPAAFKERKARWKEMRPDYGREFYAAHREAERLRDKARSHPTAKERQKRYRVARKADPQFRLTSNVRNGLYRAIRASLKGGYHTFELLGYSVTDLMGHLERQFEPGMSWANYGASGWQIDHIVPLAFFTFKTPDDAEFRAAWALANMRPLWATENKSKGGRRTLLL